MLLDQRKKNHGTKPFGQKIYVETAPGASAYGAPYVALRYALAKASALWLPYAKDSVALWHTGFERRFQQAEKARL